MLKEDRNSPTAGFVHLSVCLFVCLSVCVSVTLHPPPCHLSGSTLCYVFMPALMKAFFGPFWAEIAAVRQTVMSIPALGSLHWAPCQRLSAEQLAVQQQSAGMGCTGYMRVQPTIGVASGFVV